MRSAKDGSPGRCGNELVQPRRDSGLIWVCRSYGAIEEDVMGELIVNTLLVYPRN